MSARSHDLEGCVVCSGDGMELGVHADLVAPDQAVAIPSLTRRLDAVRCASTYVASIMTAFGSASPTAGPSIMRVSTPGS